MGQANRDPGRSEAGPAIPDTAFQFQAMHDGLRSKILRYLVRLVGPDEAEDLAQVAMFKANESLRDFRGDCELSTWIYRIATNAALDRFRSASFREAKRAEAPAAALDRVDDDWDEPGAPPEARAPSVEATAIRGEMNDCIREFVERLPEPYKIVVVLSELEGFKNREIAGILGVSLDTVKIRLHRAREMLRGNLATGCCFHHDERNELACDRKR